MAITPAAPVPPAAPSPGGWQSVRAFLGIGSVADWLFKSLCRSSAVVVILLVALIVALLSLQAWPAIRQPGSGGVHGQELESQPEVRRDGEKILSEGTFDVVPFIWGSIVTSIIAMLLAVPLGVGTAAFLSEIAGPSVKRGGSFLVELLAAIPSVVYGFWGVNFLRPGCKTFSPEWAGRTTPARVYFRRASSSPSWSSPTWPPSPTTFFRPCRAPCVRGRWPWAPPDGRQYGGLLSLMGRQASPAAASSP